MSTPTFTGVLFDLDGVLVDTHEAVVALWRELAGRHDRVLIDRDIDRHVRGCSPEHTVERLFGDLSPSERRRMLDAVRDAEPDLGFTEITGARDTVLGCAATGAALCLVTGASAHRARRMLEKLGLADVFGSMVTWGDTARGKPAPDCYRLAARRAGRPPAECLVLEDAVSGVSAATAAGAACLGVGDPGLIAAGATWTVRDLHALRLAPDGAGTTLSVAGKPIAVLASSAPRPTAGRRLP